ncbi:hypothetical protein VOLCADRAFT_89008 [Volvox carteri f. nagariensis]|uniref:Alanine--tRNA ligase n=1 Tax=Volvox carteri f. nagariensis TaxID=3068 RepID=D8TQJ5_VOLCA|nr:uncharacterized protein VOLCADRAFT_89008 [Volvox carteri f. nagariensis]EFJ50164.1 hypothetical protein VOLCADRAFT_89008 [Volvox carteri f. nagariensis]|eukprot:XP_002948784.1 hypothetical protein VOLCADRAFT_89008 [Volvox carteri f. nagariensis]
MAPTALKAPKASIGCSGQSPATHFAPMACGGLRRALPLLRQCTGRPAIVAAGPFYARGTHLTTLVTPSATASQAPGPLKKMSGAEIREAFLSFFESKGHTRLPSSSLVPEDPTVLLTIAGMLQFKPVFLGQAPRKVPTATTTQKCVRTNDIGNVGVTARHHTFFEMLGNFSFGDYFKEQAIRWAWELSTGVFGLPPERVWVSVFEEDGEAEAIWRDVVGVPPERIKRMGAADNFWSSGPTGPCGPCSELYYDFHPERGTEGASLEDDTRFIEFYNLVFMQLNRKPDGSLEPLAAKNIDTGMGLERMAQILQGVPNNYETDLIFPIVQKAAEIAAVDYHSASPAVKTALKVIGDHTRAVTYMLSDGVTPSNTGRGYVLRRLLRRVVMKGRLLGIREVFTPAVAAVAVGLSGPCDPAVQKNAQRIYDELAREEGLFVATLERGQKQLDELLSAATASTGSRVIGGADAFMLYDTFGFPLELTQELAEARGVEVDVAGFDGEMEAQRQRSKESRETVDLTAQAGLAQLAAQTHSRSWLPPGVRIPIRTQRMRVGPTSFTGYSATRGCGRVVGLMREGKPVERVHAGDRCEVLLDVTPFYAESGGQVGDMGRLVLPAAAGEAEVAAEVAVRDCQKAAGGSVFVHSCEVVAGELGVGDAVNALVDDDLRRRVRAHHTATHLLQSALKIVLGPDTCQQGSLVNFQRLRFDFNLARAMSPSELTEVERLVNCWVAQAAPLETRVMGLQEAKAAGATAMFGEKYDDVVRVVDVPGISMELCGGTHVGNTAEIGAFKILSESGIASGIRRVEAVAGTAAVEYLHTVDGLVRGLAGQLKVKLEEVPSRVAALQSELRSTEKLLSELKAQLAVAQSQSLVGEAVTAPGGLKVLVAELPGEVEAKAMQGALGDPAAVLLASRAVDGSKVNFVAALSPGAVKGGLQAGKVVGAVAKVCGGGGGGKPALAQAGGRDASKTEEALEVGRKLLLGL